MRLSGIGIIVIAAVTSAAPLLAGQLPGSNIHLGPLTHVSAGRESTPHVEPYLAAHPGDPDVLVGGAITFSDTAGALDRPISHASVTHDRESSWLTIPLPACGVDPWLDFDSDGAVYFSCLSGRDNPDRVIVHRSGDRGLTWSDPVTIPAGDGGPTDRPILVVHRTGDPDDERILVAFGQHFPAPGLEGTVWGPAVSRSIDGGKIFSAPWLSP